MPRVTPAHLEARREQILDAARRCFARNGFHATSMHDVIAEAGLSVGAVYRYFASKDELRTAVAEETVGAVLAEMSAIANHEPPLSLVDALARLLDMLEPRLAEPDSFARIAVQAWGEAVRDPELGEFARHVMARVRGALRVLAERARETGELPADADPDAVAAALVALVPGYILQRVLSGQPDRDTFLAGLRALLPT